MKSDYEGKDRIEKFVYIRYKNGMIDMEAKLETVLEFSWKIFDEKIFLLATNDSVPVEIIKESIGNCLEMVLTMNLEPAKSIAAAETPPSEIIPQLIDEANTFINGYGIMITKADFVGYSLSGEDKASIEKLEKNMETAKILSMVPPAPKKQEWLCECGRLNDTLFCPECVRKSGQY